jgi:hypothetical protein
MQQGNQAGVWAFQATAEKGLGELFRMGPRRLRLDPRADRPLTVTGAAPAVSAGRVAPPEPVANGFRLGHYHMISRVHPAELRLHADGLSFDPLGHTCNQAAVNVPFSDVQVGEATVNGNGEILLNIKIRDPRNAKKMLNFNFATEDSVNDSSSGVLMVRSPAGAIEKLRAIREERRRRGGMWSDLVRGYGIRIASTEASPGANVADPAFTPLVSRMYATMSA